MISALTSVWAAYKWLCKQKSELETDVDGYLSEARARRWRLNCEKFCHALEVGSTESFPAPLRKVCDWLFARTTADNQIGAFGQHFLKSGKIAVSAKELKKDME
ncbi:MAG: hypothetical protein GY934_20630 [Gammaproteobacteria bacterium]|nr:hypothetical protein [Gammaproteobacteria bacterium]